MAYSSIRTAFKARIVAISGTENVHEYHRYTAAGISDDAFRALFVGAGNFLHLWRFTRISGTQEWCPDADAVVKRRHNIEIQGYRAIVDSTASENTFQDLVDTMMAALNTGDKTLGGVAETYSLPQLTRFGAAMFGDILCHEAILQMTIEENT